MTRRRGRRRHARSDGFPWVISILAGVVLLVIIGGLAWAYMRAVSQQVALSPDLCPEVGPQGQVIVLVDTTDAIAPLTQTEIGTKLSDLAQATPKANRFEIRTLGAEAGQTETLFSLCNPGDGADMDEFTGNPEKARKRWAEKFNAPFKRIMDRATADHVADTSPIMAAIQRLAVERLASNQLKSIPTKVIVVSDMLENTDAFSIYSSGPELAKYNASPAAKHYATDLAGASFEIWFVNRVTKVASVPLVEFWAGWVNQNNGQFERAVRLQGL